MCGKEEHTTARSRSMCVAMRSVVNWGPGKDGGTLYRDGQQEGRGRDPAIVWTCGKLNCKISLWLFILPGSSL